MQERTKPCIRCGEQKPISDYYTHPMMRDGHLNKCKECCKRESVIVGRGERAKAYNTRRHRENPERRELNRQCAYRRRKANPEKTRAHYKLKRAVDSGILPRMPCQVCGNPKSEGHHEDYGKPLEVVWLCRKHHAEIHRTRKDV